MPTRTRATLLLTAALTALLAGCSGAETTLQWDRSRQATGVAGSAPAQAAIPVPAAAPPSTVSAAHGVGLWEGPALFSEDAADVGGAQQVRTGGTGPRDAAPPRPQPTPSATGPSEAQTTPAGEQPCVDPAVLMGGVCDEPASHVG